MTDEYAVMIDTRDPLDVGPEAEALENRDYVNSWKTSE
jgi:homogentisate 1,2-dioxygenase